MVDLIEYLEKIINDGLDKNFLFVTKQKMANFYFPFFVAKIVEEYSNAENTIGFATFYKNSFAKDAYMRTNYSEQAQSENTYRNTISAEFFGLIKRGGTQYNSAVPTPAYYCLKKYIQNEKDIEYKKALIDRQIEKLCLNLNTSASIYNNVKANSTFITMLLYKILILLEDKFGDSRLTYNEFLVFLNRALSYSDNEKIFNLICKYRQFGTNEEVIKLTNKILNDNSSKTVRYTQMLETLNCINFTNGVFKIENNEYSSRYIRSAVEIFESSIYCKETDKAKLLDFLGSDNYFIGKLDALGIMYEGKSVKDYSSAINNEPLFKIWLADLKKSNGERYSVNTINQYTSAIKAATLEFNFNFYGISCVEEFDDKVPVIREMPNFVEFDKSRGNGALSASLILYREFLISMEKNEIINSIEYAWYVGATGYDENGVYTDFSDKFIAEGRWENGYDDKFKDEVNSIKVGDRIAIKASYTKKNGLPFNNNGKVVGVMSIKAIGVVTKNHFDGKNIDVEWTKVDHTKEWYGAGVLRLTLHYVKASDSSIKAALLKFTFGDVPQDYSICEEQYAEELAILEDNECIVEQINRFPVRKEKVSKLHKFNTILYGAPGTGKTYATAEYALAICENREVRQKITKQERETMMVEYRNLQKANRIVFTTFHQSYGYEDFIQGLRPDTKSENMKFLPVDGVFKKIADKAMQDQENNYVVIIDEINRGNISKIFGELITLIEDDKRWGESNQLSVTLPSGDEFAVPNNLYIIGTMNSADKSISLIDIALRRRFFFIEQAPDYSLIEDAMLKDILQKLNNKIKNELRSTDLLIGHAFFIGKTIADLKDIMNGQIIPLLYEYFYDDASRVGKVLDCLKDTNFVVDDEYQGRIIIKEKD